MHIRDLGIQYDWLGRLCARLDTDRLNYPQKLSEFQGDHGLAPTGFLDAPTRLRLIETFDSLRIRTIGKYLAEGRTIIGNCLTSQAQFDRLEEMLYGLHCHVPQESYSAAIFAIRGVTQGSVGWCQTASALRFAQQAYGERTHFSSSKTDYADSLIALMIRDAGEKHVYTFKGVTSPCSIWPAGTAHLCPGQYLYKIGKHRTREPAHIEAVETMIREGEWPQEWCYERTEDSIRYAALEGSSQIEVVRSSGDSLDISDIDIARAEREIAARNPTFVDAQTIKINIHSCSLAHASSLGCQNILPHDYASFLSELMRIADSQKAHYGFALDIPYTLCDASEIAT